MATHSSILSRIIPWIEELQSLGSQRVITEHVHKTDLQTLQKSSLWVFFCLCPVSKLKEKKKENCWLTIMVKN